MNQKELKKRLSELNKEIEQATQSELREYELRKEAEAKQSSQKRTAFPLALFLIGIMGFTYAFFAVGQGPLAYFFLLTVATPGALWFMVSASKVPRWSRWREKEESIKYLNQLYLEKRTLVNRLRQLEREEKDRKKS